MWFNLITGRTSDQAKGLEHGKTTQEYRESAAVVFLNDKDMEELGLDENSPAKVTSEFGSVTVKSKRRDLERGVIFMPLGPWSNMLIGGDTKGTGAPQTKGVKVEVSKSDEEILPMEKNTETCGGG
ncbi:hypothetical protein AKJ47_00970 [candidate division MSBL1 archaeon SCGC-AAA261G05]|uniref:Molybdopterin dinucleotide-binding domain-containing protein n=1 Tax=candidate division MSBL1 archaeon SCGC-AAA261G05 TaxID=1698276 RepID=A0A133VC78_9EURY|nr:hypothetical protein AKJ47_00970 [candidate division MSBL1 archaeon SCGC-AAA261G05]